MALGSGCSVESAVWRVFAAVLRACLSGFAEHMVEHGWRCSPSHEGTMDQRELASRPSGVSPRPLMVATKPPNGSLTVGWLSDGPRIHFGRHDALKILDLKSSACAPPAELQKNPPKTDTQRSADQTIVMYNLWQVVMEEGEWVLFLFLFRAARLSLREQKIDELESQKYQKSKAGSSEMNRIFSAFWALRRLKTTSRLGEGTQVYYSKSNSAKTALEDKQSLFLTLRGGTWAWSCDMNANEEWSIEGVGAGPL